jgi:hypothetical protein
MKPLIVAAALIALAPPAFAATTVKHAAADTSAAAAGVPDAVKTYVRAHAGQPFPYTDAIRVGDRTDEAGAPWLSIPDYPQYLFSNLGNQLVVIDKTSRKVVAVY